MMLSAPVSLVVVVALITCAATAVQVGFLRSDEPSSKKLDNSEELGNPNQACNGDHGQIPGPRGYDCTKGRVCMDTARMIRNTCKSCHRKGFMNSDERNQCQNIVPKSAINTVKGVEVHCDTAYNRRGENGCFYPAVLVMGWSTDLAHGWPNWGEHGSESICPCAKKFVGDCKGKSLSCVLDKINDCPKVCPAINERIQDARDNSFLEAKVKDQLKNRARVLVDDHGKVSRNASASIISLDHTMTGKCSQ